MDSGVMNDCSYWFRSRTAYINIDGAYANLATERTTSYSLSETFFNPC